MYFTFSHNPAKSMSRRAMQREVKKMLEQGRGDERVNVHFYSQHKRQWVKDDFGTVSEVAARLEEKGL